MSHTVSVSTRFTDSKALKQACIRLDLPEPVWVKDFSIFDENRYTGWRVDLKEWNYPLVIDAEGKVHYDDFKGRWGDMTHLDQLAQIYTAEAARNQADRDSMAYYESVDETTGDITVILEEAVSAEEALATV